MKLKFSIFSLILFLSCLVYGQSSLLPLNRDLLWEVDKQLRQQENSHSLVKPYLKSKAQDTISLDTLPSSFSNRLLKTDLYNYQKGDFDFNLNPDIELFGTSPKHFTTEYGIRGTLNYKNKLSFWFKLNQGLGNYPNYIDSMANQRRVVVGKGLAMPLGPNYRYNNNEFVISYDANDIFNFQLGRANHFWGNGYRSLYLSDNSKSFPYLKLTADVWKVKYTAMWAQHKNLLNQDVNGFQNLHGVYNHLGWNVTRKINVGIFQSVTWSQLDTLPATGEVINRGWDLQYANPLIFYRPVEYSLGSPDNVIVGADAKFEVNKKNQIYFQLTLDELVVSNIRTDLKKFLGLSHDTATVNWWGNKYAIQLGWKSYDVLGKQGLDFQQEFNLARPYIYTHRDDGQGYTHFNQPLAHPLGANFYESITFLRYRKKKLMAELKIINSAYGADSSNISYGGDILKSYEDVANIGAPVQQYNVRILQGLKTNLYYQDLKLVYFINPKSNLRAEAIISNRIQHNKYRTDNNLFFTLGIKTTLGNSYTDF